jgi:hypothetical protein
MSKVDWGAVKFRASSWGGLLAESKDKKEPVGKTAAAELIKIYNYEKYGRKKDITTPAMDKGKAAEVDSITIFGKVEGKEFQKNDEMFENEWFIGHPDIIHENSVYDIKSSWELDTFMPKLLESIDRGYEAQLNCYYDLTGSQGGAIVYCLADCPPEVLLGEQRKLLYSMNVISEESPEYIRESINLENRLTFPDIDLRERVIKLPVARNEELIEKMKSKVPVLRQWLADFEKKHMNLYPK